MAPVLLAWTAVTPLANLRNAANKGQSVSVSKITTMATSPVALILQTAVVALDNARPTLLHARHHWEEAVVSQVMSAKVMDVSNVVKKYAL